MNPEDTADIIDELREIKFAILSISKQEQINGPGIGDNVLKSAKSTLVCKSCYRQVEVIHVCNNKVPRYKCPECGLERKIGTTAIWFEYEQVFKYKKVKVF